jgi:hypothetical protein
VTDVGTRVPELLTTERGHWTIGETEFVRGSQGDSPIKRFMLRKPPDLVAKYPQLCRTYAGGNARGTAQHDVGALRRQPVVFGDGDRATSRARAVAPDRPDLMELARSGDVVTSIAVDRHWMSIRRGPAELDPATWRIADARTGDWEWLLP